VSKKIVIACIVAVCIIILIGVSVGDSAEKIPEPESKPESTTQEHAQVMIAVSSSRPGCEQTDSCYLPPSMTISSGDTITWVNDDRAFHTVTGGFYDVFDGTFDSGHMNPSDKFSHTFDDSGEFHYYCRLHPWMEGTVIVN
jgi:plastocyanin